MKQRGLDIDECYQELAAAVIEQAAKDYIRGDEFKRDALKKFFFSDQFVLYAGDGIKPESIIEYLDEKVQWDENVKQLITTKYDGSYKKFADAIEKNYGAWNVRFWLNSIHYPDNLKQWERVMAKTKGDI